MRNKAEHNNKSLWDKSMNIGLNIIKESYLSLAQMSLQTTAAQARATSNHGSVSGLRAVVEAPLVTKVVPGSQKSLKPERGAKPSSYLLEPDDGKRSSYLIEEGMNNIDGRASDYIRRAHEKNQNDAKDASKFSPFILPPPPRLIK